MPKLKVYCTPIGFHDAYVAAPSQKAALEAWGSDANLFARGVAQQVDDPELMAGPLAQPGTVVKRLRGTRDEQLAALPDAPASKRAGKSTARRAAPRPSRSDLDQTEADLTALQQQHQADEQALARREAELAAERRGVARRHEKELDRLNRRLDAARAAYDEAISRWQGR